MGVNKEEVDYKFMYNSKEHQDELGLDWYDYGARNYDATLGRFMSVDPLAEKYSYQSPYNFSENRVIDAVELEGLEAFFIHGTTQGKTGHTFSQSAVSQLQGFIRKLILTQTKRH